MVKASFVTLLTSEAYLPGALVLASSIRATGTKYPINLLVTENTLSSGALNALHVAYDNVFTVPLLKSEALKNLDLLGRPDLHSTLTKIHVFNPNTYTSVSGYEKVLFLDADTLVIRNLDHVFDNSGETAYLPSDDYVLAASPDIGWPDCFNSGVLLVRPNEKVYKVLVNQIESNPLECSFDGGDQGLLNTVFGGWSKANGICPLLGNLKASRLPFIYNVTPSAFYSYLPALHKYGKDVKVVHFIGKNKPWTLVNGFDDVSDTVAASFLQKWFVFFDSIKDVYYNARNTFESFAQTHFSPEQQNQGPYTASMSWEEIHRRDIDEFSNYRVSWNTKESSPITGSAPTSGRITPSKATTSKPLTTPKSTKK